MRISDWISDVCSSDPRPFGSRLSTKNPSTKKFLLLAIMRRCCDARAMVYGRKKYSTCLLTASCAVISVRSANMQSQRGDHDSTGNTLEASRGALRIVAAEDRKSTRLNSSH